MYRINQCILHNFTTSLVQKVFSLPSSAHNYLTGGEGSLSSPTRKKSTEMGKSGGTLINGHREPLGAFPNLMTGLKGKRGAAASMGMQGGLC